MDLNQLQDRQNIRTLNFFEGNSVIIAGFLRDYRKLGKILFLKIADCDAEIQVIIKNNNIIENFDCKKESILLIKGFLRKKNVPNKLEEFGDWEIELIEYSILSNSNAITPFPLHTFQNQTTESDEDIRLKYRYLDLRGKIKKNLIFKSQVKNLLFNFFVENGFVHIDTPALSISSNEGSNTFNTSLIVNKKLCEFSLSQSPQLYKQLLMIGGFEKYFQFATAFRLEDLREDRQFEFTQLDIEMSFQTQDYLFNLIEQSMKEICHKLLKKELKTPFMKLPYKVAYEKYGSDKPDLRFNLEIISFSPDNPEYFGLFWEHTELNVDELQKELNIKVEWVKKDNEKFLSSHENHEANKCIKKFLNNKQGYLFFIVVNEKNKNHELSKLGKIRNYLGKKYDLYEKDSLNFLWITEWPLFEFNYSQNKWVVAHHIFTSPLNTEKNIEIEHDYSRGYDLVLNGIEIASGSERIHNRQLQEEMFIKNGLSTQDINNNFSWFLQAFDYGVPPHMGIAIGLDRLIQLLLFEKSIREVIAFPKNNHGFCPLTSSPKIIK